MCVDCSEVSCKYENEEDAFKEVRSLNDYTFYFFDENQLGDNSQSKIARESSKGCEQSMVWIVWVVVIVVVIIVIVIVVMLAMSNKKEKGGVLAWWVMRRAEEGEEGEEARRGEVG